MLPVPDLSPLGEVFLQTTVLLSFASTSCEESLLAQQTYIGISNQLQVYPSN